MIDQHVHTKYSPDSNAIIDDYLLELKRYKNEVFTFTDHFDYLKNLNSLSISEFETKFNKIFKHINNNYNSQIKVGIEIGYNNNTIEEVNEFINKFDFSIILLSIHDNDELELPYYLASESQFTNREIVMMYIKQLEDAINNFDNFDVLTHIGYIFRFLHNIDPLEYVSYFDNVLELLIKKNKALEFNTGCIRYGTKNIHKFYLEIFTKYNIMGGKYISVGSDAHDVKSYCYGFELVYNTLKRAGFSQITQIVDREFIQIDIPSTLTIPDQHLHTNYSPDSKVKIDEYLEFMEMFNNDTLTITDHLDIVHNVEKHPDHDYPGSFDLLFNETNDDRVKIGVEVGYNPNVVDEINNVLNKNNYSIVLLSIHENDVDGFKYTRNVVGMSTEEKVRKYINQMKMGILSNVDFDVLAHLGFVLRYCNNIDPLDYVTWFDEVLELLAQNNKALEFNTGCFYYGTKNIEEFYFTIFTKFLNYGGKYVSIGSDSHEVLTYSRDFDFAINMLKEIGFEYVTVIKDRKFIQHKI